MSYTFYKDCSQWKTCSSEAFSSLYYAVRSINRLIKYGWATWFKHFKTNSNVLCLKKICVQIGLRLPTYSLWLMIKVTRQMNIHSEKCEKYRITTRNWNFYSILFIFCCIVIHWRLFDHSSKAVSWQPKAYFDINFSATERF